MEVPDEAISFVVSELTERHGLALAAYQPGFIVGHVLAACKYRGVAPACHRDLLAFAIGNLHPKEAPDGYGMAPPQGLRLREGRAARRPGPVRRALHLGAGPETRAGRSGPSRGAPLRSPG